MGEFGLVAGVVIILMLGILCTALFISAIFLEEEEKRKKK